MNFITEDSIEEERKKRQTEWEKVRKPSDPVEAPTDNFDNRTLYDKLKEQHEIKKRDFEDQFAFKNQIRGIDTDEAQFLDEIDRVRYVQELKKKREEKKEIEEYKKAIQDKNALNESMPKVHVTLVKKDTKTQSELLSKVIVAKRKKNDDEDPSSSSLCDNKRVKETKDKIKPIIAVLPGVGEYNSNSSSSSDYSSDDEIICVAKETSSIYKAGGASHSASAASK